MSKIINQFEFNQAIKNLKKYNKRIFEEGKIAEGNILLWRQKIYDKVSKDMSEESESIIEKNILNVPQLTIELKECMDRHMQELKEYDDHFGIVTQRYGTDDI